MPMVVALIVSALVLGLFLRSDGLVVAALLGGPLALVLARLWGRVEAIEAELRMLRSAARAASQGAARAAAGPGAAPGDRAQGDRARGEGAQPEHAAPQPDGSRSGAAAPLGAVPEPGPLPEPLSEPVDLPDLDFASEPAGARPDGAHAATAAPQPAWTPEGRASAEPSAWEAAAAAVSGFFTDGNLVVRVGILVLFLGVAFLLKYAAEHSLIPLPLRLGGVAAGGLVLLGIGWRLRHTRRLYALLLQGAGVGIAFLTAFAAARLFGVLEPLPALVVMVVLVAAAGALAVAQDAPGLAGFGVAGGFLAPILVSTGTGSHVALFSYYAVLNLGILGMAWFKAWKALNLEGFLFTFGLGTLWGARYYRPEYFDTVEPFLLLNFVLYIAVAILFAVRQPVRLRGLVDGTLVFGLPLVVFALQGALVADWGYGLAWSAAGLGLAYLVAAGGVRWWGAAGMGLLGEAFLALAVTFLTVAVPLAFDGHWTSALWAAEGAALVWVGVRQTRLLARLAGVALQLAAGIAFLVAGPTGTGSVPVLNGDALGYLLLALGGLFSSQLLERHAAILWSEEAPVSWLTLAWGGAWWLALGTHETDRWLDDPAGFTVFLAFLAGSGLMAGLVARWLGWRGLGLAGLALLPLLWAMAWLDRVSGLHPHPLAGWNGPAWALAFGVHLWLLRRCAAVWPERPLRVWHGAGLWLLLLILGADLGWWGGHLWAGEAWRWVGWALPALLVMAALVLVPDRVPGRLPWPVSAYPEVYRGDDLAPVALGLAVWAVLGALTPADPSPLPFVPLLNPLELTQLGVVALLWRWASSGPAGTRALLPVVGPVVALVGFVVLSGWVAQGVHHLAGVAYRAHALFDSTLFQASLSMVWGLTALAAMWLGNRRGERPIWAAGALLLGLVVAKLFVADLAGTGSVARIVSFIGVGVMMLAVGYLAPLPPRPGGGRG